MFYCAVVTIKDKTKFHSLYDILAGLVGAGDATTSFSYDGSDPVTKPLLPVNCQEVQIQAGSGNGAKRVYVGDRNLSATNFGSDMAATSAPLVKRATADSISLKEIYLGADTNDATLNVAIELL